MAHNQLAYHPRAAAWPAYMFAQPEFVPVKPIIAGTAALFAATAALAGAPDAAGPQLTGPALTGPQLTGPGPMGPEPMGPEPMGSVTRYTPAMLEGRRIDTLAGLAGQLPNLVGTRSIGSGSSVGWTVRGQQGVATIIDGVEIPAGANDIGLFDGVQIDVARGPQGQTGGPSALAGAIRLTSPAPAENVSGRVELGYGADRSWLVRGGVSLPMSDMIGFRLSAFWMDDDGRVSNSLTGERANETGRAGLRFAAHIRPLERLSWQVAAAYLEVRGENMPDFPCDGDSCDGRSLSTGMTRARRPGGAAQYDLAIAGRKAGERLGSRSETTLLTSALAFEGEYHRLDLLTGHVETRQRYALDLADGRGLPDVAVPEPVVRGFVNGGHAIIGDTRDRRFSQDVRLSGQLWDGFTYVVGGTARDTQQRQDLADLRTLETGSASGQPLLLADRLLVESASEFAGFGTLDIALSDRFHLSAGLRYAHVKGRFALSDQRAGCTATPLPDGCIGNISLPRFSTGEWLPQAAVSFLLSDTVSLHAGAARGFRPAGWSGRALRRDAVQAFAPESSWTYDAGLSGRWMGDLLRLNLTGFVIRGQDVQVGSIAALSGESIGNPADFRNHGLEVEVGGSPVAGLNLWLNLGWQSARFRAGEAALRQQADCAAQLAAGRIPLSPAATNAAACASGIITADGSIAKPAFAPDWTLALGGSWDIPVPKAGILVVPSVDVSWRSAMETTSANATLWTGAAGGYPANPYAGDLISGSYAASLLLVKAAIAVRTDDDNWLLALECSNCLDRVSVEASALGLSTLTAPRAWMVRARRQF